MRPPLIVLISAYGIAVLGFTLIPGVDDQGQPWRMSFFEAFYVVSYTGSTIGFGEVPYTFSAGQRLWTMASIYLTVSAWLYSIGTLIALVQDDSFRHAMTRARLLRSLRNLTEPFYLVCGYGDTGRLLVRSLLSRDRRVVVLDRNRDNIEELRSTDMGVHVPAFCMAADVPENLVAAGLQHRWCAGVLAVTDDERVNLKAAISAKLMNHKVRVFCRADTPETSANMLSFGTDLVVDPCAEFARRLQLGILTPDTHRVYDWLTSLPDTPLPERPQPLRGRWILCGFGAFGRAIHRVLLDAGIEVVVVSPDGTAPPGCIHGVGTEAATLREAGIEQAAALVAGTDSDADNLSIMMTARQMKASIYLVALENRLHNRGLFRAFEADLPVQPSFLVASRFMSVLASPLLREFLDLAAEQGNDWNRALAAQMRAACGDMTPESWTVRVSSNRSPAVARALELGEPITLDSLCRDPRQREHALAAIPLLLRRDNKDLLLPAAATRLHSGDRLLFCGTDAAQSLMNWNFHHLNSLRYVHSGELRPDGWLWRRLARRQRGNTAGRRY